MVTADIGSDVNLMDDKLLQRIIREGGKVDDQELSEPRMFNMAVKTSNLRPVSVVSKKVAVMPVELHTRHGKTMLLRNVHWMVIKQCCEESLLSRPLLERIGLVARGVIERAAKLLGGVFDVA